MDAGFLKIFEEREGEVALSYLDARARQSTYMAVHTVARLTEVLPMWLLCGILTPKPCSSRLGI